MTHSTDVGIGRPKMRPLPKRDNTDPRGCEFDGMSLAEMRECLSAKYISRTARIAGNGETLTDGQVMSAQRAQRAQQ